MPNMLTAKEIKSIREKAGMTQLELAEYLGVTLCTVGRWECELRICKGAAVTMLKRLASQSRKHVKQPA